MILLKELKPLMLRLENCDLIILSVKSVHIRSSY